MVRIGIAGIGFMGVTHFKAYQKIPNARVEAICTRDPKKLRGDWRAVQGNFGESGGVHDLTGIRKYTDWRDLLADPDLDLIDICLPTPLHTPVALEALAQGKHVLVEKPIAETLDDADAMVEAAQKASRVLAVGQVLRFFPEFALLQSLVEGGEYGPVLAAHFKRMIATPWFQQVEGARDTILELHIHDADFIRFLFGMPHALHAAGFLGKSGAPAYLHVQYAYPGRNLCVTVQTGSIAMPTRRFEHGYEVYFERATVRFNSATGTPVTLDTHDKRQIRPALPFEDAFRAELEYIVQAIERGEEPSLLSGRSARDSLYLCEKTRESIQTHREVLVSETLD